MKDGRWSALVTGGGRGLGRAIGERLAAEGATVGLLARTAAEVVAAAEAIRDAGGDAIPLVADVLDRPSLERAVERFRGKAGGIDTLVCAAGRLRGIGPIGAVDPDEWWLDLATSLRGAQHAIRAVLPSLRASDRGSIALLVGPGHNGDLAFAAGYGAAQAALVRLVESLDREFQADGLPIFAVHPGLVPTTLIQHLLDSPDGRRRLPRFTEAFAEGKEVGPEVVAEMVAWLATRRPFELSGRVVAAPSSPTIYETRLARIQDDDLGVLRLR
ncbi:MAG TPA: SDR family oxidoreductase [Isosphaeraceae bacterium]|jgi:3-oxoacyl-[acyl-carrier protein] reductase|nr:SDR family oxidoreductase [Isosphaeraceae bacterium]